MHELSLMHSTLAIALEYAHKQNVQKILQINLRVGAISGVIPEALTFAFDACSKNTIAAGSNLHIELVPALCLCQNCHQKFSPTDIIYICPNCGEISSQILQGREMELSSIEVA